MTIEQEIFKRINILLFQLGEDVIKGSEIQGWVERMAIFKKSSDEIDVLINKISNNMFNLKETLKDIKKYKNSNFEPETKKKKKSYTDLGFFDAMRKTLPEFSAKNIRIVKIK